MEIGHSVNCLYPLELPACKDKQKISAEHCNDQKIPHKDNCEETLRKQDNNDDQSLTVRNKESVTDYETGHIQILK